MWSKIFEEFQSPVKVAKSKRKHPKSEDFRCFSWSCWADLNRRPHPYQAQWATPPAGERPLSIENTLYFRVLKIKTASGFAIYTASLMHFYYTSKISPKQATPYHLLCNSDSKSKQGRINPLTSFLQLSHCRRLPPCYLQSSPHAQPINGCAFFFYRFAPVPL